MSWKWPLTQSVHKPLVYECRNRQYFVYNCVLIWAAKWACTGGGANPYARGALSRAASRQRATRVHGQISGRTRLELGFGADPVIEAIGILPHVADNAIHKADFGNDQLLCA